MKAKHLLAATLALLLAAPAAPVWADNGKPKGVPPGLAKKPGQMPPGQYKKRYNVGQPLPRGYYRIDDLNGWRLPPPRHGEAYVRIDGEVYRIVRDTAVVLETMGIVADLFN